MESDGAMNSWISAVRNGRHDVGRGHDPDGPFVLCGAMTTCDSSAIAHTFFISVMPPM